jgi:serine/threonine protein kinase
MQAGAGQPTVYSEQRQSLTDFTILQHIGRGNNAKVFLARTRASQDRVLRAIRKDLAISNNEVPRIFAQKQILSLPQIAEHAFIIDLITTFQTDSYLCFGTEYAPGGDLMHHIQKGAFGLSRARLVSQAQTTFDQAHLFEQILCSRTTPRNNILTFSQHSPSRDQPR